MELRSKISLSGIKFWVEPCIMKLARPPSHVFCFLDSDYITTIPYVLFLGSALVSLGLADGCSPMAVRLSRPNSSAAALPTQGFGVLTAKSA